MWTYHPNAAPVFSVTSPADLHQLIVWQPGNRALDPNSSVETGMSLKDVITNDDLFNPAAFGQYSRVSSPDPAFVDAAKRPHRRHAIRYRELQSLGDVIFLNKVRIGPLTERRRGSSSATRRASSMANRVFHPRVFHQALDRDRIFCNAFGASGG
jgi:hypothetical protein